MLSRVANSRRSSLVARVLALALLFGQFGAEAHNYSHLSDDSKGLPDTTQVCLACLSFAPLASAVGNSPSAPPVDPCASEAAVPELGAAIALDPHHPAFRSRAPPAVL